jgi:hypothetical protein
MSVTDKLDDWREAVALSASGRAGGKLVIVIDETAAVAI